MNENLSPVPKEEIYGSILSKEFEDGSMPDAIFVLSGGTELHESKGYRSPAYSGGDFTGLITGGRARVIAAAEVGKHFPDVKLVTTSKSDEEGKPTDAKVMADEIIERGVEPAQVELEEDSMSTLTELIEMIRIAIEKGWNRIVVLTNGYHVPRVKVMFDKLETIEGLCSEDEIEMIKEFKQSDAEVSFISAEDIMVNIEDDHGHHYYKNLIDKVEESEAYAEREKSEQKGVDDLMAGRYKVRR